jgi:hypothetical protein
LKRGSGNGEVEWVGYRGGMLRLCVRKEEKKEENL